MTPVLLSFNESKFSYQKQGAEILVNEVQSVVSMFNSFGFEPLKSNELNRLFLNPAEILFDKVTKGQPIAISGVEIDKVKAMEFIKKPQGFENLESKIIFVLKRFQEVAVDYHLNNARSFTKERIENVFDIDGSSNVFIKQKIFDELKNSNELYATTPVAAKMYELAVMLLEKSKEPEISNQVRNNGDGLYKIVKGLFKQHEHGKEPQIDIEGIIKYNQPGFKY